MEKIFENLKCFFFNKIGLKKDAFDDGIWKRALSERMTLCDIDDPEEYYRFIMKDPHEFQELVEIMVVPESWFFREVRAFRFVAKEKPKKILSLACSTGEEPYSILMTLIDEGTDIDNLVLDAVDISKRALACAREGVYTKNSFRGKEFGYRRRFFKKQGEVFCLNEELKEKVGFYYGNIVDPDFRFPHLNYEMIFCRNIFIYLHGEAQHLLLQKIENALADEGILITTAAESEIVRNFGFSAQRDFPSLVYFRKKIKKKRTPSSEFPRPSSKPLPKKQEFREEKFDEEKTMMEAMRLADSASYEEAAKLCNDCLEKHGVSSKAYFLLGMICQATGDFEQAEEYFKKAVYLEPRHYESLVHLTLLAERRKDVKNAKLFRERAMRCSHER